MNDNRVKKKQKKNDGKIEIFSGYFHPNQMIRLYDAHLWQYEFKRKRNWMSMASPIECVSIYKYYINRICMENHLQQWNEMEKNLYISRIWCSRNIIYNIIIYVDNFPQWKWMLENEYSFFFLLFEQ